MSETLPRGYERLLRDLADAFAAEVEAEVADRQLGHLRADVYRALARRLAAFAEAWWPDPPQEPGVYWFYGAEPDEAGAALRVVRVHRTGNGCLVYVSEGVAMELAYGARGAWQRIEPPSPPKLEGA